MLLLPDYGLAAATPKPRPLQPLKLPDPDPLLAHLATESAAYWGGLQALSGTPLLAEQQSLDVVLDPELDHPGALGFSLLEVRWATKPYHLPLSPLRWMAVEEPYHSGKSNCTWVSEILVILELE